MSNHSKSGNEKVDNDSEYIPGTPEFEKINADQKIDTFSKVKEFQKQGVSIHGISQGLGINRNTVRSLSGIIISKK